MDCFLEMMKEMALYRIGKGETEEQAVGHVWTQMFGGDMTMELQEAMYVAIQSCRGKYPEFNKEYQRLGKEFQDATMEAA